MYDVSDLRATIVPKSDQLNSEQLLAGPMTLTVTDVRTGSTEEQPVIVHYAGENGRPYKPCKTMRKVLILAWGPDGRQWVGRSMTVYCDPSVKFGGSEVGGIRISHLSDIQRDIAVSLTATKGRKAPHVIKRLDSADTRHMSAIRGAETLDALKDAFTAALKSTRDAAKRAAFAQAKDERKAQLEADTEPTGELAGFLESVRTATSAETAALVLDEARDVLSDDDLIALSTAYEERWPA